LQAYEITLPGVREKKKENILFTASVNSHFYQGVIFFYSHTHIYIYIYSQKLVRLPAPFINAMTQQNLAQRMTGRRDESRYHRVSLNTMDTYTDIGRRVPARQLISNLELIASPYHASHDTSTIPTDPLRICRRFCGRSIASRLRFSRSAPIPHSVKYARTTGI